MWACFLCVVKPKIYFTLKTCNIFARAWVGGGGDFEIEATMSQTTPAPGNRWAKSIQLATKVVHFAPLSLWEIHLANGGTVVRCPHIHHLHVAALIDPFFIFIYSFWHKKIIILFVSQTQPGLFDPTFWSTSWVFKCSERRCQFIVRDVSGLPDTLNDSCELSMHYGLGNKVLSTTLGQFLSDKIHLEAHPPLQSVLFLGNYYQIIGTTTITPSRLPKNYPVNHSYIMLSCDVTIYDDRLAVHENDSIWHTYINKTPIEVRAYQGAYAPSSPRLCACCGRRGA